MSTCFQISKNEIASATATAFSDDKVVEAIEINNEPNFIGVQWHPELLKESKESKKLFSWLQS